MALCLCHLEKPDGETTSAHHLAGRGRSRPAHGPTKMNRGRLASRGAHPGHGGRRTDVRACRGDLARQNSDSSAPVALHTEFGSWRADQPPLRGQFDL